MKKISFLLPTLKRPDGLERCIKSIVDNVSDIKNIEVICGIDKDDRDTQIRYNQILEKYGTLDMFMVIVDDSMNVNDKYYLLYKNSKNEIITAIADDNEIVTKNYDILINKEFSKKPDNVIILVWNDGEDSVNLYRHIILHKDVVEAIGNPWMPQFKHYFTDNIWTAVSKFIGRNVYNKEIKMIHYHPAFGNAPVDSTTNKDYIHFMADKWLFDKEGEEISKEMCKKLQAAIKA